MGVLLNLLKKNPIDFGQGYLREKTKGKQIALSLIRTKQGGSALDVGCGFGAQTQNIQKKGYKVTAVDTSVVFEGCIKLDLNEKLPFNNNSFDLVWCSEVIEHLKSPNKIRDEMFRILKSKGQLILTTPNSFFWFYRFCSLFGFPPNKLQRNDHLHFFSITDIKKLFPNAKIFGFFPYLFLKFKITKFIGFLSPTFVIYQTK